MTLSTFTRTNATVETPVGVRFATPGGGVSRVGLVVRRAASGVGKAIVMLFAYLEARKRLEARAPGDLFDNPVLWAEIKSAAWAEARDDVERRKDRL
jgi:hypothetical protein